jgi:hypothetical protein
MTGESLTPETAEQSGESAYTTKQATIARAKFSGFFSVTS